MPTFNMTNTNIQDAAAQAIVGEINHLIEGANEDIQAFAVAIASSTVEAAAAGDTDALAQLADQTKLLIETNRLRIVAGANETVAAVLRVALSVAVKLVIPTI